MTIFVTVITLASFAEWTRSLISKLCMVLLHGPVWYENLSVAGVISCPENSNINTDGQDSAAIGSRDQ